MKQYSEMVLLQNKLIQERMQTYSELYSSQINGSVGPTGTAAVASSIIGTMAYGTNMSATVNLAGSPIRKQHHKPYHQRSPSPVVAEVIQNNG